MASRHVFGFDHFLKVVYRAKDGTGEKVFDALEWLAAMCSRIPDRGEQMGQYLRFSYTIRASSSNGNPNSNFKPTVVHLVKGSLFEIA